MTCCEDLLLALGLRGLLGVGSSPATGVAILTSNLHSLNNHLRLDCTDTLETLDYFAVLHTWLWSYVQLQLFNSKLYPIHLVLLFKQHISIAVKPVETS